MIRAIIIDDNKDARNAIRADIEQYCPQINLVAEADSVVNAALTIQKTNPELIFLDIDLGDGSGFDLLEIVKDKMFKLIFTTASDAHAIKAFKYSAIDYLLKPIDTDELIAAVEKVAKQSHTPAESIKLLMENTAKPNKPIHKLALNTLEKIHVVNINEIIRCEADVNYTIFYFADKTKLMVTKTLKEYEALLAEKDFMRVHQSHLVNLSYVKEFVKSDGGYLVLKDGTQVPVSSRKRMLVIEAINTL